MLWLILKTLFFELAPVSFSQAAEWVEGVTEDGHTYYYNTQTGGKESLFSTYALFQKTGFQSSILFCK